MIHKVRHNKIPKNKTIF